MSRDTKPASPPAAHDLVGASLMRRADAAGQRLFRELVASRIAWGTVSEVSRLIACDVVGFAVRTSGCAHEAPCALHHCQNALRFTAVLGNRGPRLPGLTVRPDAGCLGNRVLDDGRVATCDDYAGRAVDADLRAIVTGEEGVRALAAVPVGFGAEVRAVLYVGMRHAGAPSAGVIEALTRVCGYAGAGMAAARDRARVEEIAAQRERRRLARALHDDLGQRLFGLGIQANQALRGATSGRPDLLAQLEGLAREVAGTNGALRRTLHNLDTPPTPAGALAVTLRDETAGFRERTGVPAHPVVLGEEEPLDGDLSDCLLRAVQEGLRNADRHARAREVVVTLAFDAAGVEAIVHDDGVGLAAGAGRGLGMRSLEEETTRLGGELRLSRGDDTGSTLRVRLPWR